MKTPQQSNCDKIPYSPDGWSLVKVEREGWDANFPFWDEGYGPVWVYRESLGIVGFIRAKTWDDAWQACVDEIMLDAEPFEEWDDEDKKRYEETGELPEGMIHRGNGVPSNKNLMEPIAQEDLNGSSLELLTLEFCKEHSIKLYWTGEDFEFTGRMVKE